MKSRWTTRVTRRLLSGALGMASASLYAQTLLSLPAQPLASALSVLASQSGTNILAAAPLVANRRAPAISGRLNVPEALGKLLQGSGLIARKTGDKTYLVQAAPPVSTLPVAHPDEAVLPTIMVTGADAQPDSGFTAESTRSATRTDTPLDELPQSAQVVTAGLLKSQQSQSVSDALHNVSGVEIRNGSLNGAAAGVSPVINGFQAQVTMNGNLSPDSGTALNLPMAAISRIEVLKGADAIVSGSGGPGGTVNVEVKKPQATPVREVSLQAGSYGDWLGSLDLAGTIAHDTRLTYRFIVSGETAGESYGGMLGKRDLYVAPSLRWKSGGTDLIVGFEQHTYRTPLTPYASFLATGLTPIYQQLGNQQAYTWTNSTSLHYDWTQKINPALTFRSTARFDASSSNSPLYLSLDTYNQTAPGTAEYDGLASVNHTYTTTFDNNLQMEFRTGPIRHTLLVGVNYQISRGSYSQFSRTVIGELPPVGLIPLDGTGSSGSVSASSRNTYYNSFYLQDQIAWQRLHVLVSMTRPRYWTTSAASVAAWVPNVGMLYQLTENLGVFANAQRSFSSQQGYLEGGAAPPPLTGRSIEAGLKFELLDDKLDGTVAVHRSTYNNEEIYPPGSVYPIVLPAADTARGVSIDLAGKLWRGLNITAHYSYNDYVIPSEEGPYVYNATSRHSGSLWATYDFQAARLHGWGVGGGIWLRGSTPMGRSLANLPQHVPGQARVDATVYYTAKDWSARLAIKNVFNRYLYGDGGFGELAPGRLIYLTTTYDF